MSTAAAKAALADDDTVASAVCVAARNLLGEGWLLWEPESIWLELHHMSVDVPLGNRQQLMAGRGVLVHGRCFFDGLVFDRVCAAFANEVLDIDGLDETLAMHLAWGVDEIQRVNDVFEQHTPLMFDREVEEVVAAQLVEEGLVLAPEILAFAQPTLDRMLPKSAAELKNAVTLAWAAIKKGNHALTDMPYPETARGVQVARLAAIEVFLNERRAVRAKQLSRLHAG